jgi:hypothetical protein
MFDGLPSGHDQHLFSNVLHDWDVPAVQMLLAHSFRALRPGGRVAVHDCHVNAEKTGPAPVAEYSVLLMATTQGRCYSVTEVEDWLMQIGFLNVTYAPTIAHRSLITARKPS